MQSTLYRRVAHILELRSGEQMARVAAWGTVTRMAHDQCSGIITRRENVGDAMSKVVIVSKREPSVSTRADAP